MDFKKAGEKYFVRIDKGEEIVETLKEFCNEENIKAGTITGIGATDDAEIGYFETATKEYHSTKINGDHEIAPMIGNITTKDGETYLHIHINLAGSDNKAKAGHLNKAVVSGACEVFINTFDGIVEREFDEEIGLDLLDLK